jgi:coenzyme F420-reducing hydrogenase delta subunit
MRLVRVMCSGRVDLEFILRAFTKGQDGVFIGGCRLGECNYITHGNFDALSTTYICKKIMAHIGLKPERLRIDFMSGADGNLLAEFSDEFARQIKALGPIVNGVEGMDADTLQFKLDAARKLVPYLKLVERERLRVPVKTEEAYQAFFNSEEINALIDGILTDKLAVNQIIQLLKETPLSTSGISERLGMNPSDVSKYMNHSSNHGLVMYDTTSSCYVLAQNG